MRALTLVLALCAGFGCAAAPTTASGRTAAKRHRRACHARQHRRCPKQRKHRKVASHVAPRTAPAPPVGAQQTQPAATTPAPTTTTTPGLTTTTTVTTPAALPSRLGVDESEYTLNPTHDPVAAGVLEFNVDNLGMDAHTFAIKDAAGRPVLLDDAAGDPTLTKVDVPAGSTVTADSTLPPGTYTLYCTLPHHAKLGMQSTLTVQ